MYIHVDNVALILNSADVQIDLELQYPQKFKCHFFPRHSDKKKGYEKLRKSLDKNVDESVPFILFTNVNPSTNHQTYKYMKKQHKIWMKAPTL